MNDILYGQFHRQRMIEDKALKNMNRHKLDSRGWMKWYRVFTKERAKKNRLRDARLFRLARKNSRTRRAIR